MNRVAILSSFILISFFTINKMEAQTSSVNKENVIDLLDENNAPKWRGYEGKTLPPGWSINNGILSLSNNPPTDKAYKGGHDVIFSGQEFDYFELTIEWKIANGANSGIFYHVKEGFGSPSNIAPEYQLIDDENFAKMNPNLKDYNSKFGAQHPELLQDWQKTGADYAMHTANEKKKILHPAGEWNTTKIIVAKGKTEHWLNGVKLLSFKPASKDWYKRKKAGKWAKNDNYSKFKTGYIALQSHGGGLSFRNIKIKSLN